MEDRIKRKLVWENKGVSEIIGTILMLAITVVLFSSIIIWIGQIPAPRESFQVDLEASIEPVDPSDWGLGVDVIVSHQGGVVMIDWFISIVLSVDAYTLTKTMANGGPDMSDGEWSVGEEWRYRVEKLEVNSLTGPVNASTFSILIINVDKNNIIFQETIGEGESYYPPIILDAWIDSDLGNNGIENVVDPGPITYTDPFKVFARIIDPEGISGDYGLDENNLWVNLTTIYGPDAPPIQLLDTADDNDAVNDDVYVAICDPPRQADVSPGNWFFIFNASDVTQPIPMSTERHILFPVGMIVGDNPQIIVREINFNDEEPVNGDEIIITATIWNRGGVGAEVDVWFYDGDNQTQFLINTDTHGLNLTDPPDGIPDAIKVHPSAQGEVEADMVWEATPGGVHMIVVEAKVNETYAINHNNIRDPYPNDNIGFQNLTVMPKILLVDDDSHLNDKSDYDTVSFMRASLEAADFTYDFTIVGAGDGPGYDYGDYPLQDFDVVIWMTGYRTMNTITTGVGDTDDVTNLEKYLSVEGNWTGNGGSLWFISQGFWDEAVGNIPLTNFAIDYLNVPLMPPSPPSPTAGLPTELYGNDTHNATDSFATKPIITVDRVPGGEWSHYWNNATVPQGSNALYSGIECYAATYDSDDDSSNNVVDSRIYTQTWDFSRVRDTATQAQYTYKVIMWLGNITMKFTRDVAISEQTVSPEIVFYKQEVSIKFVIRNNGYNDTYTTADDLFYRLRILDVLGNELPSPVLVYEQIDYLGWGYNNTRTYYFNWTPLEIGFHRLEIKVDPDNRITESNEQNNEISNYLTSGELFVQYRILVVDDDASPNNYGGASPNYNETLEIYTALNNTLNATGNYRFEQFVVDELTGDHMGPTYDQGDTSLNKYNAVLWVTGEDTGTPLQSNDTLNIRKYLDIGGNFWLIGNGLFISGNTAAGTLEQDYLRIQSVTDSGTAATYRGVRDDAVSHGMAFSGIADVEADTLVPIPAFRPGVGFFYQDDAMSAFNSVRYEGPNPNATATYRAATTAWLLSSLDSNESKAEIVFMMLRWFDKPEERIEARITDMDIWLSNEHPQLGSGYVIQATVHNTGGSLANVLVRFVDGTTQIGSDSISVSPDETTTAEIVWIPLFAGQRTLNIYVDPIAEVDEIFEWSNNNATKDTYVYFFWDDMESGTSKWAHSSTILLINGEEPLDYFYDTDLDTNILTTWDQNLSIGVNNINAPTFYHTYDTAYWLQEPAGGGVGARKPLDVVFALDTSGSMSAEIADLRTATKDFIGQLTENDRAAIWTFDGLGEEICGPIMQAGYAYMDLINRTIFNATIDTFTANGYTCFYDTLGMAMQYSENNMLPERLEYVIGMTDGVSNSDDIYTPNADWGQTVAPDNNYSTVVPHPTEGLLYPPMMVYTIGLGISHDPAYPEAGVDVPPWSRTPPDEPSYPIEYDVWHCADSSPVPLHDDGGKYGENATTSEDNVGHYYYTQNSASLPGIFQEIFSTIQQVQLEGENQTKSGGPVDPLQVTLFSETFSGTTDDNWLGDDDGETAPSDEWWYVAQTVDTNDIRVGDFNGVPIPNCVQFRDCDAGWGSQYMEATVNLSGYMLVDIDFDNIFDPQWTMEPGEGWRLYLDPEGDGTYYIAMQEIIGSDARHGWAARHYDVPDAEALATFTMRFDVSSSAANEEISFDNIIVTGEPAVVAPWVVSTVPADGTWDVPVTDDIVVTFSEQINPITFAWNIVPDPDPGNWTEAWSGGDTIVTLTHPNNNYAQSTVYTVTVTDADDMDGNFLVPGPVPNPWSFTSFGPPMIIGTDPFDGETGVAINRDVVITFSEPMNTGSVNLVWAPSDPGRTPVWSGGNTIMTFPSPPMLASGTNYTLTVNAGTDTGGTPLNNIPYQWSFNVAVDDSPRIDITAPFDGEIGVAVNTPIVITFSEPMEISTVTYICLPDPGGLPNGPNGPAPAANWSVGDTVLTLTHTNFVASTIYVVQMTGQDTTGSDLIAGPAPNPWSFTTIDVTPPRIILVTPSAGSTGVGLGQPIIVQFNEPMSQAITEAALVCTPEPGAGGWTYQWNPSGTQLTAYHYDFAFSTVYKCTVYSFAEDIAGNSLDGDSDGTAEGSPTDDYTWSFTTGTAGGGAGGGGMAPPGPNFNKTAVTETMNLDDLESAKLSFWHKYNMISGANGGFLQIGYKDGVNEGPDGWAWKYVIPANAYTGNLRSSVPMNDSFGQRIYWCWNGVSTRGTFSWDYVSVDLLNFVPDAYSDEVKVKFNYTQYGGGTGYGWYIDDVRVTTTRPNIVWPGNNTAIQDIWNLTNMTKLGMNAHSGNHSWSNVDPTDPANMKPGIDNYLITTPIDLTSAKNAQLSAYFKFNFNEASGAPPDGFRVEVSKDGGVSWIAINFGVRSSWGVSGSGADINDGAIDGRAYTGICDSGEGNEAADDYWVNASSLSRVNVDLSSFSGNAIQLRFRVVTCDNAFYDNNNNNAPYGDPGFGGFYVDDVIVYGETILT